jgi:hypothetical protein
MTSEVEIPWDILDSITDEVGELELDGGYILRYEGWGSACVDAVWNGNLSDEENEQNARSYANEQSAKIVKDWTKELQGRGYALVIWEHEKDCLSYGKTWALFKRSPM